MKAAKRWERTIWREYCATRCETGFSLAHYEAAQALIARTRFLQRNGLLANFSAIMPPRPLPPAAETEQVEHRLFTLFAD